MGRYVSKGVLHRWSKEEDRIIEENYALMSAKRLAAILPHNRTPEAIRTRAHKVLKVRRVYTVGTVSNVPDTARMERLRYLREVNRRSLERIARDQSLAVQGSPDKQG